MKITTTKCIYSTRISSLDLAPSYEAAKAAQEKATEASSMNYARKRSMLTEAKHFREQQEEIKQWERLNDSKVSMYSVHCSHGLTCGIGRLDATPHTVEIISPHQQDQPVYPEG